MLNSYYENKFKKDLFLAKKRGLDISLLNNVVTLILTGVPLPAKYRNHKLKIGKYKNCFECHITPDWLLIYRPFKNTTIYFTRTGSHSDLF
jgi:mRNA interferase YafQ